MWFSELKNQPKSRELGTGIPGNRERESPRIGNENSRECNPICQERTQILRLIPTLTQEICSDHWINQPWKIVFRQPTSIRTKYTNRFFLSSKYFLCIKALDFFYFIERKKMFFESFVSCIVLCERLKSKSKLGNFEVHKYKLSKFVSKFTYLGYVTQKGWFSQ